MPIQSTLDHGSVQDLERVWHKIREDVRLRKADSLIFRFTDSTHMWLDSLAYDVRFADSTELVQRPLFHVLMVGALRIAFRKGELNRYETEWLMARLLQEDSPFTHAMLRARWGAPKVEFPVGFIGLANNPEMAILGFKFEYGEWKLDLRNSLPVLFRGLEAYALRKRWNSVEAAKNMLGRREGAYIEEIFSRP